MKTHQLRQLIMECLRPLKQRILMTVSRGIVDQTDDSDGMQIIKGKFLADEVRDGLERFQEFGFTSRPPDNSECVAVFVQGNREHGIIVGTNNRQFRLKNLEKGETAIYTDDGTEIVLKKAGQVEVTTAVKVTVTAPDVQMTGNLKVDGNIVVDGNSTIGGNEDVGGNTTVGGNSTVTGSQSAASMTASGAVTGASVADSGGTVDDLRQTYNTHTHGIPPGPPPNQTA